MAGRRRTILVAAVTIVVFVVAWFTGRRVGVSSSVVTRLYDVREFIHEVPDFDNAPNIGLRPLPKNRAIPQRPSSKPSDEHRIIELAQSIRAAVDPESWKGAGRGIAVVSHHLAVSHTADGHEKVAEFLRHLRAARSTQISIEARVLRLDVGAFDRVPQSVRRRIGETSSAPLTDDEAAEILLALELSGAVTVNAPRITVFSGQRAYVMTSTQRAYVAGLSQVSTRGSVTFEPEIDVADSGFVFDLHATASPDRRHVTVTLQSQLSQLIEIRTADRPMPGGSGVVQAPLLNYQTLQSTIEIPAGKTALLVEFDRGRISATRSIESAATQPAKREKILLFIKPAVVFRGPDTRPVITLPK